MEKIVSMIAEERIQARVRELAESLNADYAGKSLVLACVLTGGVMFLADLSRRLDMEVEFDFISMSSYGDNTESSGKVQIDRDINRPIEGRHVLIIEDIVDTGRTLNRLIEHLSARNPASLKTCVFLDKPSRRTEAMTADYIGFEIPDRFIVGYGLDYARRYRNLPYIGELRFEN